MLNGRSKNDRPAKYTYVGPHGKSVIDVAWVNEIALTKISNFEILYSGCVSDHFPSLVQIEIEKHILQKTQINTQKLIKLEWDDNKRNE
jgi:hypothetical protein